MTYDQIKALPLLFTSKPFGNDHVRKECWQEVIRKCRLLQAVGHKLDDIRVITVHEKDCRDGTGVYHYELHGKV